MRIAQFGVKGIPSKGGAERVVEALVRCLSGQHSFTVYCNKRYVSPEAQVAGVSLVRIPTVPGKYLQPVCLFIGSAFHALFRGHYDLIHVHNAEACFIVPFLRLRYRVVATSHGLAYAVDKWGQLDKGLIRLLEYFFIWFPNVMTSVSLPVAEYYRKKYQRNIRYVPNGVDTDATVNMEAAETKLKSNGVKSHYILFVAGRLDPIKGCHLLLQASEHIKTDRQLVVVGGMSTLPKYGQALRKFASAMVRFVPFIESRAELFGIVRGACLFVFPSTVEAMSMMLLEVASLGVPILCSDIPANTAILPTQAKYFRSGEVNDLAEKLHWSLEHPEAMAELGRQAKVWVKEKFSWEVIAEEYNQVYQTTVEQT